MLRQLRDREDRHRQQGQRRRRLDPRQELRETGGPRTMRHQRGRERCSRPFRSNYESRQSASVPAASRRRPVPPAFFRSRRQFSILRRAEQLHRLGRDDPDRPVAALDPACAAAGVGKARLQEHDPLAVELGDRRASPDNPNVRCQARTWLWISRAGCPSRHARSRRPRSGRPTNALRRLRVARVPGRDPVEAQRGRSADRAGDQPRSELG